jgi:3-hydroxybutyrate dehydrogenase
VLAAKTMLPLRERVAFVTGSTSGIGLGIARALAAAGADVALNGFGDPVDIEALRAGLEREFGVRALYHGADMSKESDIAAAVAFVQRELGGLDILVNNAGIQHTAKVEEFPPDKWHSILAINLSSAFFTAHYALPLMRQRGWGRIVNIASVHGLVASAMKSAYVAAKHGLVGLTKVIALETAGSGITANTICPGWVLTPLVQKQIDALATAEGIPGHDAAARLLSAKQPSLRFVTTEEIGGAVVFLASDGAASITGTSLPIDGGWTAQ